MHLNFYFLGQYFYHSTMNQATFNPLSHMILRMRIEKA